MSSSCVHSRCVVALGRPRGYDKSAGVSARFSLASKRSKRKERSDADALASFAGAFFVREARV